MTQAERILQYMRMYGSITPIEALENFGCMRLTSRICDLKQQGFKIKTETVAGKNRFDETTHFAKYSLEE